MNWLLFGILAQASASVAVYIDNYVLEKHLKDYSVIACATGCISFIMGLTLYAFQGFPLFSTLDTAYTLGSGILLFAYLLPYMKSLEYDDPSRVVPLFQITTLFALILSYVFYGTTLSPIHIIGFVIILASGIVLSIESDPLKVFRLRPAFWYMMLATFLLASSLLLFDSVSGNHTFLETFSFTSIGMGIGTLLISAWPPYTKRLRKYIPLISPRIWLAIFTAELFNFGYQICLVYAVSLSTPSLAALTESTQPAIILAYGLILTRFFPSIVQEDTSRAMLLRKGVVILMIILGFYVLNL